MIIWVGRMPGPQEYAWGSQSQAFYLMANFRIAGRA